MADSRVGVVAGVKEAREIESTWRVYRKEWLFESRQLSEEAVLEDRARFEDRLSEDDIQVRKDDGGGWCLYVRRWNVSSEWKTEELALRAGGNLNIREDGTNGIPASEIEVVARNSRREHELIQYGILKI